MILSTVSLHSQSLGKKTEVNVLLPANSGARKPFRVLWLLHGMGDDHSGWLRQSLIENLGEQYNMGLVMPNGDLGFYVDMAFGGDYCTWIARELPEKLTALFPLSSRPEDNFIAGISMGGYGAFYIAMNNPEKFNTAASLSGPMRIDWINAILTDRKLAETHASGNGGLVEREAKAYSESRGISELLVRSLMEMSGERTIRLFGAMFGVNPVLAGNRYDLFYCARQLIERKSPLRLMAFCGEQDYHYSSNMLFSEFVKDSLGYSLVRGEGAHTWEYWNRVIPLMLERLG
jgi:S-formylglutathione hydrolase FrmB